MLCNYYIFPDMLGVKKYNDDSAFQKLFTEKYSACGMQEFSFINDKKTSTNLVVMSNESVIVVIFRGSEVKGGFVNVRKDWLLTDAKCKMVLVPEFNNSYVHKGFWKSYSSVEDTLIKTIVQHQPGNKKIFITGHSLGGALAVLAAIDFSLHNFKPFGVYTFANPRVGGERFAEYYTQQNIPTFRYVNENDIVPMMPPTQKFHRLFCPVKDKTSCGKYQHVGIVYNIKKDKDIVANDDELKVPNKTYRKGKIVRHNVLEYCDRLYYKYFPCNDSINIVPCPPKKSK
jgi:hypothetical protein